MAHTRNSAKIDRLGKAVASISPARIFHEGLGLKVPPEATTAAQGVKTGMVPLRVSRLPLLLGIDTSGAEGSIAVGRITAEDVLEGVAREGLTGKRFADELVPRLKQMLEGERLKLADLSGLAIVTGPGSFTGLRVGIGVAKGLAEAAGLPVIGVSRLALLGSIAPEGSVPVLDAGRGEFYLRDDSGLESLVGLAGLADCARPLCICEPALQERLSSAKALPVRTPDAVDALRFAIPRFRQGAFEDVATLDANYVRRPYTEQAASS